MILSKQEDRMKTYKGNKTKLISFSLGGIGTGSIGLAGNGSLVDWEIFNRPFKGSVNGFTNICVRAEENGSVRDVRVLQGDYIGSAIGGETVNIERGNGGFGYGFGPYRGLMAGVPHFKDTEFAGEFPFAEMDFRDEYFPGHVKLRAFNPFIPQNDRDSSLPAAFFEIEFENTTDKVLDYTAYFSVNNLLPFGTTRNRFREEGKLKSVEMTSDTAKKDDLLFGNFCLATDAGEVSCQEYWYRAQWFDSLQTFWDDIHRPGPLKNRHYSEDDRERSAKARLDGEDMATLAAHLKLEGGQSGAVRFVFSWYFPNCCNYWNPSEVREEQRQWKNYYASMFENAYECSRYSLENWKRLYGQTKLFKDTLYKTSLPDYCLEAVSANMSILKTATCLRLEDGSFYGFEGCSPDSGCCEGSCSHVWNYAYALPFLFPKLERSMRDLEYKYSQREDGSVSFRLMLPLGRSRYDFRACVDGQMGGVIKVYRDFRLCGDIKWLEGKWEAVKKSLEFAWAPSNEDKWDADMDGVMEGRQHHTLDMEMFGPSSWLNGFYQAALKAGSRIAHILGHEEEAQLYEELFKKGMAWSDTHLFNGEYYQQQVDLKDKSILEKYNEGKPLVGKDSVDAYWNQESEEIKYQIANGSSVDQVIGQWHANLCGLGDVFDRRQVKQALGAVYKYNFKKSARNEFNAARIYCMNDEGGVRVCAWPGNKRQPAIPMTYSNEVMCGMEYQAASHMIQEGLLEEGFEIVRAVRERFDGEKRNPWNEFECGSNYARSMASFALIPSISGFTYDMYGKTIGFDPKQPGEEFTSFWSVDSAWGIFEKTAEGCSIQVLWGGLKLKKMILPFLEKESISAGRYQDGRKGLEDIPVCLEAGGVCSFDGELVLEERDRLVIQNSYNI